MLDEILIAIGKYTIVVGSLGALCYFFINWRYKKIELQFQSRLDVQLSEVNSMLEQSRGEHSVAFNLIYAKREERIVALWASWSDARQIALDAIKPDKTIGDLSALTGAVQAAISELNKFDFYFPADFVELWHKSLTDLHNACVNVHTARHQKSQDIKKDWEAVSKAHTTFLEVWNSTRGDMRRIVQRLIRVDAIDKARADNPAVAA